MASMEMKRNSITWYMAKKPKRSGWLEHRFNARGPNTQDVVDWLSKDNDRHGKWQVPKAAAVDNGLTFSIQESTDDPKDARRTRGYISRLKLCGADVPNLIWKQH